jgi:hypothetical protein
MVSFISTLLLVRAATAQITTSFPYFSGAWGSDKIGFYGSVVNVQNSHTVLALELDNGTDTDIPNWSLDPDRFRLTLGPNMFEGHDRSGPSTVPDNYTNELDIVYHCDLPASSANAAPDCTASIGPWLARRFQCDSTASSQTSYTTQTYTYSGRLSYSAGVETLTRTARFGPNTRGFPTWCSDSTFAPSSGWQYPLSVKREEIATFQLVITAGQEKLSATPAVSAGVSSATPTGAGAGSSGAAMPMKTAAPVIAGLGVAVAVFL